MSVNELETIAKKIRSSIVRMAHKSKSAHVGCSLSCTDILVSLYFKAMTQEDRFILSKGHGAMAYYAALAEKGVLSIDHIDNYSMNGGKLPEHPPVGVEGIEFAAGSLGHGLSVSLGCALARKVKNVPGIEYVLLGDGECNEGSIWEAAMFAGNSKINNIIAVVDRNNMQSAGFVDSLPMSYKWRSFGWNVFKVDGHNFEKINAALQEAQKSDKPSVLIASTIKGKGVSFMEDKLEWHYRSPNEEELKKALEEINA